jgi:hypothetical protein
MSTKSSIAGRLGHVVGPSGFLVVEPARIDITNAAHRQT